MTADVIIVGARCAGATLARLLAADGVDVVLIDRSEFPSDTVSTHCITLPGLRHLARQGLLDEVLATPVPLVRQFILEIGNTVVPDAFGTGPGAWSLSPRRTIMDAILIEAASRAGAAVRLGASVTDVLTDGGAAVGVAGRTGARRPFTERARLVIGADGRCSLVARRMAARLKWSAPSRLGGWYGYFLGIPANVAWWAIGDRTSAGAFPTHQDLVCVWAMSDVRLLPRGRRDHRVHFLSALRTSSERLFEQVRAAAPASSLVAFAAHPGHLRQQWGPGWALVGDASYYRHPITAHGMSDAFRDAELLAESIRGALDAGRSWDEAGAEYARRQESVARAVFEPTQRLAAADWSPHDVAAPLSAYKAGVQAELRMDSAWWGAPDLDRLRQLTPEALC